MSEFQESIAIKAPIDEVYATITDFEHYPKHFPDIEKVKVHSHTKGRAKVTFEVNFMKRISYTLDFKLAPPHSITWSLVEGDFLKSNDGSWTLARLDERLTDATMKTTVGFSMWVPKMIAEGALKGEMHKMIECFKRAAEGRAARHAPKGGTSPKK
jgi:ribosome-associated toxin RatA of RatAB toxin-antitoxin module